MSYIPPVIGSEDWGAPLNQALSDIDDTAEAAQDSADAAQATADGKADAEHTHDAGDVVSGTLPVGRGGTGRSSFPEDVVVAGGPVSSILTYWTPNVARNKIGADDASNLIQGAIADARLSGSYTNIDRIEIGDANGLTVGGFHVAMGWQNYGKITSPGSPTAAQFETRSFTGLIKSAAVSVGRGIKVTFQFSGVQGSTATPVATEVCILKDGVVVATCFRDTPGAVDVARFGGTVTYFEASDGGTHTWSGGIRHLGGVGEVTVGAGPDRPAILLVEDVA